MDDEKIQVLEAQYREICEENAALLKGVLGQIRIVLQEDKKNVSDGKEDRPKDLLLKEKYLALDQRREAIRLEIMEQKYFPCLSILIPSIKETEDAYVAAFDELMEVQVRSELQTERANQVVADAIGSGYALYICGGEDNETDLTIGLSGSLLLRNSGNLPCGEVYVTADNSGTNGMLHLSKFVLGGKEIHNLRLSFEDGVTAQVSYDEAENAPASLKTLSISSVSFGLNMTLLEKLTDLSTDRIVPEEIFSKTCLKIDFGTDGSVCVPYERVRSICSIKTNGMRTDVIREGLFMPIGSDAMNMPLMRVRRKD